MLGRIAGVLFTLSALAVAAHAAPVEKLTFPAARACRVQPVDPTILYPENTQWSDCEKWVWSCLREGKEANLFAKECFVPRTKDQRDARKQIRLAPFFRPSIYERTNALSDRFIIALLTNPAYTKRIAATGIRIYGGYFKEPVNLENIETKLNLVLDGSMMQRGLRLTNFKSESNLSLDGSNIRGSLLLMRARIDGSLFIEAGVFDTVDLRDSRIGSSVEATGSMFNDDFQFDRADIDGKLILVKARLTLFKGWDAHVGGSLEMRLADVRRKIDLTAARIDGDVRMQDVTFGRQEREGTRHCDWNPWPENKSQFVLNELRSSLQDSNDFRLALAEVVETRPSYSGASKPNPCDGAKGASALLVRNEALLRDMRIQGALCIVEVSGEIETAPGMTARALTTLSLDGTNAKSTILSWKDTESATLWRAVNFKTGSMLINLNAQPKRHFIDNLDVGFITFGRVESPAAADDDEDQPEEHLVKYKCESTQVNINDANERETQSRIAGFFKSDLSGSAQPFSAVVARLDTSGVATLRLKKELSAFQSRNACTNAEFSKAYREFGWFSARDAWRMAMSKKPEGMSQDRFVANELGLVAVDAGCNAFQMALKHMVYYGHEPWRLILWALAAVVFFRLLLLTERRTAGQELARRHLGFAYALDNLIPVRMYRIDPNAADELPNKRILRIYRAMHRGFGLLLVVFFFFFVYKAST